MKKDVLLMKMRGVLLLSAVLLLSLLSQGQSKIGGTPGPADASAYLQLGNATGNTKGFLPPRVTKTQRDAIATPATGLMVYCTDCITSSGELGCLQTNDGTTTVPIWRCIGAVAAPNVTANCNTAAFNGTYKSGVAFTAANTFTVTVTNNSFGSATIAFNITDLVLSGVTGVSVSAVNPATATLAAGAAQTVTYSLSGTPAGCTMSGEWTKLSLSCTKTKEISSNVNCAGGSWSTPVSPMATSSTTYGLQNGQVYSGTYTIPYTSSGGCSYAAETITQSGLSFSRTAGTTAASGTFTYTLSGTYTGTTGGSVSFTTAEGCVITGGGVYKSAKEILAAFPAATDGVYMIDPDGTGSAFPPMQAQCDMTTDGGGWTMILNYLHLGGTNPATSVRTTLPIITSTVLGNNESSNTSSWGHMGNSFMSSFDFTSIRFYGKTSGHGRIIHFKTSLAAGISYIKTGIGNFGGITGSYTLLSGHSAILPAGASAVFTNMGNGALLEFPFYAGGNAHWHIGPTRWEVDDWYDFPPYYNYNTYHQVWVR